MTNNEYGAAVFNAQAFADKIFYLPLNADSGELKEFLESLDSNEVKSLFPDIKKEDWEQTLDDGESPMGLLQLHDYEGWLIKVNIPNRSNFKFKEGKEAPVSWNINYWICRVEYIYCESFEEILPKIKEISDKILQEDIAQEKAEEANG